MKWFALTVIKLPFWLFFQTNAKCLVVFGCMLLLLLLIDISQEQSQPQISKGQIILHLLSSPPSPNAVDSHCILLPPSPSQLLCASTFLSTLPSPSNICFLHPCSCAQECLWQKPVTRMAFPTRNLFSPLLVLSQQNTSPNTNTWLQPLVTWTHIFVTFIYHPFTAQDCISISKENWQRMTWIFLLPVYLFAFHDCPQVLFHLVSIVDA